jgi:hypothetical protein
MLYYKGYGEVYTLNIRGLQKSRIPEESSVEMGSHLFIPNEARIISIISELAF